MAQGYIALPADTWTQIVPVGGYQVVIQPIGNVAIIFGSGTIAPGPNDVFGIIYGEAAPQTLGDDSDGLWARPAIPGVSSGVNVTV